MKMSNLFNQLHQHNKLLAVTGWVHVVLLLVFLLLMPLDTRLVTGANPWIKPAKFALSITIFVWTVAWLLSHFSGKPRRVMIYSILFSTIMLVEMAIIGIQAVRGTTSHFNVFSSPLNAMLFSLMGIFITINLLVIIVLLIDFFIQKTPIGQPMLWAIRLGLFVMILGSLEGFVMIRMFSHTVGAARRRARTASGQVEHCSRRSAGSSLSGYAWIADISFTDLFSFQVLPYRICQGKNFCRCLLCLFIYAVDELHLLASPP
jgi:hypothetical protein